MSRRRRGGTEVVNDGEPQSVNPVMLRQEPAGNGSNVSSTSLPMETTSQLPPSVLSESIVNAIAEAVKRSLRESGLVARQSVPNPQI